MHNFSIIKKIMTKGYIQPPFQTSLHTFSPPPLYKILDPPLFAPPVRVVWNENFVDDFADQVSSRKLKRNRMVSTSTTTTMKTIDCRRRRGRRVRGQGQGQGQAPQGRWDCSSTRTSWPTAHDAVTCTSDQPCCVFTGTDICLRSRLAAVSCCCFRWLAASGFTSHKMV